MNRNLAVPQPKTVNDKLISLQTAVRNYESAVVACDVFAASAWFDSDDGAVSRFGPNGGHFGACEVERARSAQPTMGEPVRLRKSVVSLAHDGTILLDTLPCGDKIAQLTEVWVRRTHGWCNRHVHDFSPAESVA